MYVCVCARGVLGVSRGFECVYICDGVDFEDANAGMMQSGDWVAGVIDIDFEGALIFSVGKFSFKHPSESEKCERCGKI